MPWPPGYKKTCSESNCSHGSQTTSEHPYHFPSQLRYYCAPYLTASLIRRCTDQHLCFYFFASQVDSVCKDSITGRNVFARFACVSRS